MPWHDMSDGDALALVHQEDGRHLHSAPHRSPDWASERWWLRTPHLFARAFFVNLSRFFAAIFERKNWQPRVWVERSSPAKAGFAPPAFGRRSALTGPCHPASGCCQSLDGELQKLAQFVAGAMTLRYAVRFSLPRLKGRTKFHFRAWRRRRRATGRRPSEGRERGRDLELCGRRT